MTRLNKVKTIAIFEFLSTVKRKSYLIATFGMPLFVILYAGIISLVQFVIEERDSRPSVYGIIDPSGIIQLEGDQELADLEFPDSVRQTLKEMGQEDLLDTGLAMVGSSIFRPFHSEQEARKALAEGELRGYFLIASDYLSSGKIEQYRTENGNLNQSGPLKSLRSLLQQNLLKDSVSEQLAERIRNPVGALKSWTIGSSGEVKKHSAGTVVARLAIPLGFTFLLFTALMMSSGYLVQAVAVEKENKVIEVLLSSVRPEEILAGKLIGLGAAGLLQVIVWFSMVLFSALVFAAALAAFGVEIPWGAMGLGVIFFLAGYLFLGSLMIGFGSLGSTQRESQQLGAIWSLLAVVPMMFLGVLLQNPHSVVGQVMTWIPFTAPVTMLFRLTMDPAGVAWWEVVGSLLVLLISIRITLAIGARLFRIGLVLTGVRPKFREILRQARLGN